MSCFPSFEPLSDSPDTNRYERALQAAAGRFSGSESCGTWSLDDAAAFWLPGWRPPTKKLETLPADGVMGLATKAFATLAGELPLVGPLFAALGALQAPHWSTVGPYHGMSAHSLCCAAHMAFGPGSDTIGEQFHGTGFRALAEKRASRCNMPDCQESESMLGRCLPRPAFDAASRSGLLRPSRAIDAGPLALLITRLACWRTSLPYIAVRDGEQHFKFLSCPYWVHDAVTNLAHLVPRLLVDPETQLLIRSAVASSAVVHLRQLHGQLSHDRWNKKWGRPVRGVRTIVAVTVDSIWRLNVRPLRSTSPYGQPRGT